LRYGLTETGSSDDKRGDNTQNFAAGDGQRKDFKKTKAIRKNHSARGGGQLRTQSRARKKKILGGEDS